MTQPDPLLDLDLPTARDRLVARLVDRALANGWRSAEDFVESFPPGKMMEALSADDALRASLLAATTGVHEKIASRKPIESAAEDLQLALDEGITDAEKILEAFPLEDRVRVLDPSELFAFVAESDFNGKEAPVRLTQVVEAALAEDLVTLQQVFDGLTFDEIAGCLPPEDVRSALTHALRGARSGFALDEERFLEVVSLGRLLEVIPPDHVWERVVVARIAAPAELTEAAAEEELASDAAVPPTQPAPSEVIRAVEESAKSNPPKNDDLDDLETLLAMDAVIPEVEAQPADDIEVDVEVEVEQPSRPYEDAARQRVVERLRDMERLPPRERDLSLANLLSIESMYADLELAHDDEERERVIVDAFPNEDALRKSVLALIELLDASVDTRDPVIRKAEIQSLVKVVLFEERRRQLDGLPRPKRSVPPPAMKLTPPPPPPPSRSLSSLPPPPKRATTAPPSLPAPPQPRQAATLMSLDELQREVASARELRTH